MSELRNTRKPQGEIRNTKKKDTSLLGIFKDLFEEERQREQHFMSDKLVDLHGLDEKIRDFGEKLGLGHGEGKGIFESLEPILPNTGLDIALMGSGIPKAAAPGTEAFAGGIPFFQRATKLGEKLGVEDASNFAETLAALRKRIRKGEKIDLGDLDDEVKELLTSGLQRVKGTNPRATGKAPSTPPIPQGKSTYFKVTKSGNVVHIGPNPTTVKEGEALILQDASGKQIVAEGNLSSKMKSSLDSADLNSLKPQSYTKRYASWLDEANTHFQGVKGTDVKPLGEKDGALLVEFPNPEGGKWLGTIRNGKLTSAAHLDTPLKDAKGLIQPDQPAGTDILRMVKGEGEAGKDVEILKEHLYKQNPMASGPQTPGFQKSVERYKQKQMGVNQGQNQTGMTAQTPTSQGQVQGQAVSQNPKFQLPGGQNPNPKSPLAKSGNLSPAGGGGGGNPPPSGLPTHAPKQKPPKSHPTADFLRNALGTFKTAKSVLDLPVGRHAIVEALAHPLEVGGPSLSAGLQATFSPRRHHEIQMDVLHSLGNMTNTLSDRLVNAGFGQDEALGLADKTLGKLNLNDLLQQFPSQWLEHLPGAGQVVKASERGYTSSLNTARTNRLSQMISQHPNASLDDIGGMVNMVNDFTGAGDLGRLEPVADILAAGMFSPRLLSSRVAMLNPMNYIRGGGSNLGLLKQGTKWGNIGKTEALKDMSKFAALVGGGLGATALSGGDVEVDPRSSDFLSPQVGDTTFDVYGGMKPIVNTAARLATGKTKRPWGEIVNQPKTKTLVNFARSKLAPGPPSMLADMTLGEDRYGVERDLSGDPIWETPQDFGKWIGNQVAPMWPVDMYQAFTESGPLAGALTAGLGVTGIGSQTYPRKKKEKKKKGSGSVDIIK